ncbi:saccharopine dehydrogenase NADP-binding domain-containing protein [Nocardia salmonicida]|uniref:saccharopine dehydrogenase NADP-binding domain-containing protein n=1 Tax=Nocardia salmonicida TaxID=53431 RepID=UPI0033DDF1A2
MPPFPVAVYGAYGHTGRLLVADLSRRGLVPVLCGRDARRLAALAAEHPGADVRPASLAAPADLDRALTGVAVVINCAGPFGDTPPALLDAARRAGVHYLDVAGEALVAWRTFTDFQPPDSALLIPAAGFFGALGDLLASVAYGAAPSPADEVSVAIALNGWTPTEGSVRAGKLRAGRRVVYVDGHLDVRSGTPEPVGTWQFPPPFGRREVTGEFPTADVVTIARHLPHPGHQRPLLMSSGGLAPANRCGTELDANDAASARPGESCERSGRTVTRRFSRVAAGGARPRLPPSAL